ncbi:Glycosyltransferase involved in cell wall bisynthesis [Prevotella sp. ne3005]|uniref:glycosyltransferase family 2 protein n=1 Tax=Prevotella sp. ne3005 TaxID=1761887 RepID=UPI0008D3C6F4|nr:glycosyltransferase family 2 protein [Prevotella sp. ne3005]SEM53908.1 Glycosyltransferase involved in cell wall bisynthesis [Prevotella sp. ne3005]
MIDNGKISIIVPMYNCAEYAPKCIDNILSQSYTNWELWLVHGDSNDGTEAVCQKYEDLDSRIHNIFHIDGLVPARNVGYERATGDWIMYIDGDDWIDGDCLVSIMEAAKKYNNPDVIFWKVLQDLNGKPVYGKMEWACQDDEHLYKDEECRELARHTMIYSSGITTAYAKLVRLDWAKAKNIYHDKRLRQGEEGVEYSLRVFYYASKALFLNKYYNHYRYTPTSLSKSINEKNTKYMTDSFLVMEEDIDGFENRDEIKRMYYQRVVYGLIAMAMSTYFHPNNPNPLSTKVRKFKEVIASASLYKESIQKCPIVYMDKLRIIILYLLRCRMYWLLAPIAQIKQFLLKRGYFKY